MDKSILFHAKYTIAVVKFILHQGQIHGFFALCMMFRSLQFASAHSLRFASPRISLAVCTQPKAIALVFWPKMTKIEIDSF